MCGNLLSSSDVSYKDASAERKSRRVGEPDCFLLAVERRQTHDRPERLLRQQTCFWRDIRKHQGRHALGASVPDRMQSGATSNGISDLLRQSFPDTFHKDRTDI